MFYAQGPLKRLFLLQSASRGRSCSPLRFSSTSCFANNHDAVDSIQSCRRRLTSDKGRKHWHGCLQKRTYAYSNSGHYKNIKPQNHKNGDEDPELQSDTSITGKGPDHRDGEGDDDDTPTKIPLVGKFKNPIVEKLWAARHDAKKRLSLTDSSQQGGDSQTTDVTKAAAAVLRDAAASKAGAPDVTELRGRIPRDSEVSIDYPFSTDEFLLETYRNPWGQMRFGKILEDLDALAGNIAFNHVDGNPLIVTAGVDRIRLRHRPVIGADQSLSGKVTWVGTSSMEIRMNVKSADESDEWLEAFFTFVTLDPKTKRPIKIAPLIPETREERAHFELGALRAKNKKIARKNQLRVGQQLTEMSLQLDMKAAELLAEAGPLLRMPSLADPNTILMESTRMQNAMIAQPQVRNLHDRIFGGFLMRRAYELAFANAYLFGGTNPRFLEVDDISFESPVDVGDLLVFNSRVLYTLPEGGYLGEYIEGIEGMPLVMVEVESWVTEPEKAEARISNHFYFTFGLPNKKTCRKILPGSIDEARRMATRMAADLEQASLRS